MKATSHYIHHDDDAGDNGDENDNETSNYMRVMGKFNSLTFSYY